VGGCGRSGVAGNNDKNVIFARRVIDYLLGRATRVMLKRDAQGGGVRYDVGAALVAAL